MENIEAVIKIGGNIIKNQEKLKNVCNEINRLTRKGYKIVVVPGGGELVENIRRIYKGYKISDNMAHWMAIKAMDINGMLISDFNKNFVPVTTVKKCIKELKNGHTPVFLTYQLLKKHDNLPKSWDVTSDSITVYITQLLNAKFSILLKDVEGIFEQKKKNILIEKISARELKNWKDKGCVDNYLPELLLKYKRDAHIISGLCSERLEKILNKKKTIETHITCH